MAVDKQIVMAGVSLQALGGMTSVVRCYQKNGLFDRQGIRYLETYRLPGWLNQVRTFVPAVAELAVLLAKRRVSLLHVNAASRGSFWRKAILCALARLAGVPYVFHLHCGEFLEFYRLETGWLGRRIVETTLEHASTTIVLTEVWRASLQPIFPCAHFEVLSNPVDPVEPRAGGQGGRPYLLFLGRLREKKGVFDLVHAFAGIAPRYPSLDLVLAGDGELEQVRSLAEKLGVGERVHLAGWVDGEEKDRLLVGAALLVLPSYFEGLPICLLEAMSAGVPVVACAVGGIPEVLADGECGVLVPPGDVGALCSALCRVLDDAAYAEGIVSRGRQRVTEYYAPQAVLSKLEGIYQAALAGRDGDAGIRRLKEGRA